MKVPRALALLLLVVSVVESVPTKDEILTDDIEDFDQIGEDVQVENTPEDIKTDKDVETDNSQGTSMEEEYGDEAEIGGEEEDETVTIARNKGIVNHGDTIALQTFVRSRYLSCAGHHCDGRPCPKMEMAGSDWKNCWGEVFEIYRQQGPGSVKNGDTVALHYPREKGKWLGCYASKCVKATCPGAPTYAYGFASKAKWIQCWGEVFYIYSKNVPLKANLHSDDDIVLYYAKSKLWVAQGPSGSTFRTMCLGRLFPPPSSLFDRCAYETFRIWKKGDC